MLFLGIDIGASTIRLAVVDGSGAIVRMLRESHKGAAVACLKRMLAHLSDEIEGEVCTAYAASGSGCSLLRDFDRSVCALEDVPAITRGLSAIAPHARSVVQIGGQSACFIALSEDGSAPRFAMNEGCAAGTGSFFEDQMERLGLRIEDYSRLVANARSVPRLSGRCSVFAKTDIIHRQQEGVPVEDILLGLCFATVKSYKATIVRRMPVKAPVALTGGTWRNAGVVRAVRESFELGDDELLVGEELEFAQAVGAALHARDGFAGRDDADGTRDGTRDGTSRSALSATNGIDEDALERLAGLLEAKSLDDALPRCAPLVDHGYEPGEGYVCRPRPWRAGPDGRISCVIGVDAGSTSTNIAVADLEGRLLDAQYLRTRGDAFCAARDGLAALGKRLGDELDVRAVVTTGSGRSRLAELIGADLVRDEITAQARAAAEVDARTDTVFEIGGQDSKYVSMASGQVVEFQMNKICAAGTGSFVEEQAARLGIPLDEFGVLALSSTAPVDLGERCTVFVETAIHAALAKGARLEDVAAGLCQSVVRNFLHRVVGSRPVGRHVVLQGGVAYNPGIVEAFRQHLGDALRVSPHFAISGAFGAALLALDELRCSDSPLRKEGSVFRGFDLSRAVGTRDEADAQERETNRILFKETQSLMLDGYVPSRDASKKTVGIPRSLLMYKFFPLANAFFTQLGFNVLLSDATDEETVRAAQEHAAGETCYPIKLMYGHMAQLADAGVDYVFMPTVHTIRHVTSRVRHNYGCAYMQSAPKLVAESLGFEERGIELLSPMLDMDFGQESLASAMLGVGERLGFDARSTAKAMMAGGFAVQKLDARTEAIGQELLAGLGPDDRALVIVTRQYGINDPVLNMDIPNLLIDRGQKVIALSNLRAHDIDVSIDYPGVVWPFGQHILAGMKLIRRDPRLFAVYLTNHGCGPDAMLSHLVAEEMGDKPYLQIEVDEHFSKVGVITRIEAFLNAIAHWKEEEAPTRALAHVVDDEGYASLDDGVRTFIPSVGPYGDIIASVMRRRGADIRLMGFSEHSRERAARELSSKEYFSFSWLLGMGIEQAERAHDSASDVRLVMPVSASAEADGLYGRVLRAVLDRRGLTHARVASVMLERLPWRVGSDVAQDVFRAVLAGDILLAAPPALRGRLLERFMAGAIDEDALFEAAAEARQHAHASSKVLFACGEWPFVYDDALVDGTWSRLEDDGFVVRRMPLSEYLLFAWIDMAHEDERARPRTPFFMDHVPDGTSEAGTRVSPVAPELENRLRAHRRDDDLALEEPSTEEKRAIMRGFGGLMARVSEVLGPSSSFAKDFPALFDHADEIVGPLMAGNGRYRAAKARDASRDADAVILVASMYENVDLVLKLAERRIACEAPMLSLAFDGTLDQGNEERLRSFLYYLR